jgi:hypothetical protein
VFRRHPSATAGLALVLAPARCNDARLRLPDRRHVLLRRLYVLVFICFGGRRIEYVACASNPDGAWMLQQARNLLVDIHHRRRFLIHDRDAKFSRAFDAVFHRGGIRLIRTPVQAPNANAHIERWVGRLGASASTGYSSSTADSSSGSSPSMSGTTTRGGHTARSTCERPRRSRPRPRHPNLPDQPPRSAGATSSADSSTNTKQPPHETEDMHLRACQTQFGGKSLGLIWDSCCLSSKQKPPIYGGFRSG